MTRCWLCEREFEDPGYPTILGMECPDCGPPTPMGPTEGEIRRRKAVRKKAEEAYHGDIDGDLEGWW